MDVGIIYILHVVAAFKAVRRFQSCKKVAPQTTQSNRTNFIHSSLCMCLIMGLLKMCGHKVSNYTVNKTRTFASTQEHSKTLAAYKTLFNFQYTIIIMECPLAPQHVLF